MQKTWEFEVKNLFLLKRILPIVLATEPFFYLYVFLYNS